MFCGQNFSFIHFVLCWTQQNAMLGNFIFQPIRGGGAGPSDATPMPKMSLKGFLGLKWA